MEVGVVAVGVVAVGVMAGGVMAGGAVVVDSATGARRGLRSACWIFTGRSVGR